MGCCLLFYEFKTGRFGRDFLGVCTLMINFQNIQKNENIIEESFENGVVLLNLETNQFIELNETSSLIWKAIPLTSMSEFCDTFCIVHHVSEEELKDDIEKFLAKLLEMGFLNILT